MATHVLSRQPACLSCLRRISNSFSLVQTRGKRTSRRKEFGIVVRLLEDIPKYGRKESIFRVPRGRMRNEWFPQKKAEYMTIARFAELGLTKADVGEPDPAFVIRPAHEEAEEVESAIGEKPIEIQRVPAHRARTLLATLVPEILTFPRQVNLAAHSSTAAAPISPAAAAEEAAAADSGADTPTSSHPAEPTTASPSATDNSPSAIFGSVTTADIAVAVRAALALDPEASRVVVEPRSIRFVELDEGADRVRSLGRWEVDIAVAATGTESSVTPVRKTVEVVAAESWQATSGL